jgi:hypothetical protein
MIAVPRPSSRRIAEEKFMRKIFSVAGLTAILCLTVPGGFARTPASAKGGSGTIVIVFKDGHRQTYSLSDIARVEFPGAAESVSEVAPTGPGVPLRGHFVGKWDVGDGMGGKFFITLNEDGDARRSLGNVRGKWVYAGGAALITWDDGAQDAIRKTGSVNQKFAYAKGKSFNDEPDNVAYAHNTSQRPI